MTAEENADFLDAQYDALADCVNKLRERDRSLLKEKYGTGSGVKDIASKSLSGNKVRKQ